MRRVILLLALLGPVCHADLLDDEIAAAKIRLPEGKQLSSNDLRQVFELAHSVGMKRVAEIKPPSSSSSGEPFLQVFAAEVVEGRRISREELNIYNEDWRKYPPKLAPAKKLGKFEVSTASGPVGAPYNRAWATFTIQGKQIRLHCKADVDLAVADQILAALYDGRVDYKWKIVEPEVKLILRDVPWEITLRRDGSTYWVTVGFEDQYVRSSSRISGQWKENRLFIRDAPSTHFGR